MIGSRHSNSNRRPRIAHVFPSHSWGGAEIYAVQLALAQMEAGENVVLWVPENSRLEKEALDAGISVINDPVPWRFQPFSLIKLAAVIQRTRLDVLYFHWSGGAWAFWGVGWLVSVKRLYHVHLWMKHSKTDPLHWLLYRSLDLIFVAGRRAEERVLKLLPVRKGQVRILPYAIPKIPSFDVVKRNDVGLRDSSIVIGIFARHDRQKGQLEFLKALQRFSGLDLQVFLVGDPTFGEADSQSYHQELVEIMSSPLLNQRVVSLESQREFQKYLALCDVLAVPSYHESYSLMILHAFSLGIPVLASDSGGTPDLVNDSRGWLFAPENVDAILQVLKSLSVVEIQKRKAGLQDFVQKHHTFESVTALLTQQMMSVFPAKLK